MHAARGIVGVRGTGPVVLGLAKKVAPVVTGGGGVPYPLPPMQRLRFGYPVTEDQAPAAREVTWRAKPARIGFVHTEAAIVVEHAVSGRTSIEARTSASSLYRQLLIETPRQTQPDPLAALEIFILTREMLLQERLDLVTAHHRFEMQNAEEEMLLLGMTSGYRTANDLTPGPIVVMRESVAVLSEVRCPDCGRKVGKNVNFGAELYCPRCRELFAVK